MSQNMTNREKVIEGLEAMREFFGFGLPSQSPTFEAYQNILTDALALLKEQPEIVRCKDCKHYKDGTGMCALYHAHGCAETWFCADGERKIEDD